MNLFIDFETYFTKDYSLKKLNYFQYLYNEQFNILGLAYSYGNQFHWVPSPEVDEFLNDLKIDPPENIVCHNALFDGLILSAKYGIKPTHRWIDTLSMARARFPHEPSHSLDSLARLLGLGYKTSGLVQNAHWEDLNPEQQDTLADYALNDVQLLKNIYEKLMPFPEKELDLIDLTLRWTLEPKLQLNQALANQLLQEAQQHKQHQLDTCGLDKLTLSSNKRFAEWLTTQGIKVPTKISPATGRETPALGKKDEDFKALAGKNPIVDQAIEARLAIKSTLEETRLNTLLETQHLTGTIPVPLKYYGGHTGRWSGLIYNLQNLPSRSRIRNTLCAPKGHTLVIADSASIEARIVLWLAGQQDAINAYKNGLDIYKMMASKIYNKDYDQITKDERQLGKQAVLGCGYGMSANKFKETCKSYGMDISDQAAKNAVKAYREGFNQVPTFWRLCESFIPIMRKGYLPKPNGFFSPTDDYRPNKHNPPTESEPLLAFESESILLYPNMLRLHYPNLHETESGWVYAHGYKVYGGSMTENIVQALARIVIAEQMLQAHKEIGPVVLTVHDEIVCCVPEKDAETKLQDLLTIMRTPPERMKSLPLDASGEISPYYLKPK